MRRPEPATLGARLEAAAISLKMIAASHMLATMAQRFGVDEWALRSEVSSRATQQTYDRIHSNSRPELDI